MANRNKDRQIVTLNSVNVSDLKKHFSKGRLATVVFTKKKDGSIRVLNGKTSVKRGLKGGDAAYDADVYGQLRVFDVNVRDSKGVRVGGYRAVTAQNVQEIRANGKIYKIVGGAEPLVNFVQSIVHNFTTKVLRLVLDGRIYAYFNVPREVYLGLIDAENKGRYFNQNIKGKFSYERIS